MRAEEEVGGEEGGEGVGVRGWGAVQRPRPRGASLFVTRPREFVVTPPRRIAPVLRACARVVGIVVGGIGKIG